MFVLDDNMIYKTNMKCVRKIMKQFKVGWALYIIALHFAAGCAFFVNTNEMSTNTVIAFLPYLVLFKMFYAIYDLVKYYSNKQALLLMYIKHSFNTKAEVLIGCCMCVIMGCFYWMGEQPYHQPYAMFVIVPMMCWAIVKKIYCKKLGLEIELDPNKPVSQPEG